MNKAIFYFHICSVASFPLSSSLHEQWHIDYCLGLFPPPNVDLNSVNPEAGLCIMSLEYFMHTCVSHCCKIQTKCGVTHKKMLHFNASGPELHRVPLNSLLMSQLLTLLINLPLFTVHGLFNDNVRNIAHSEKPTKTYHLNLQLSRAL